MSTWTMVEGSEEAWSHIDYFFKTLVCFYTPFLDISIGPYEHRSFMEGGGPSHWSF